MTRQLGLAAAALAAAALAVHPTAGGAATSTKPKEIVVVGSKIKAKQKAMSPNGGTKRYYPVPGWPQKYQGR